MNLIENEMNSLYFDGNKLNYHYYLIERQKSILKFLYLLKKTWSSLSSKIHQLIFRVIWTHFKDNNTKKLIKTIDD